MTRANDARVRRVRRIDRSIDRGRGRSRVGGRSASLTQYDARANDVHALALESNLCSEEQHEKLDFGDQVETFERCGYSRKSPGFALAEFSEYAKE